MAHTSRVAFRWLKQAAQSSYGARKRQNLRPDFLSVCSYLSNPGHLIVIKCQIFRNQPTQTHGASSPYGTGQLSLPRLPTTPSAP